ncbi:stage V sporulation protein K [Colletotrichum scovillei]|uniref:stage V sporulation protein K n=1 Tax=Colletotrichum scovillei TaxID=1209932 RepID=UPI0015C3E945|nr:stage V sporulation protein K [Colletotrichum scovillei]KAF4782612.1 stage V sporulation protein K [Colletotrichum scovillei]
MQFPNGIEKIFTNTKRKSSPFDIYRRYDNYSRSDGSSSSDSSSESYGSSESDDHSKSVDDASSWAESAVSEVNPEDVDDDSPSRLEWLRQKREDNEKNPHLDQLMSLVGLENVKAHFLAVKARVKESKESDPGLSKLRLHLVLHGKDGTGKKTIAKLYAQFLLSIGAVNSQVFSKKPTAKRRPYRPRYRKSSPKPPKHSEYYDSSDSDDSSSYSPWNDRFSYHTQSSQTADFPRRELEDGDYLNKLADSINGQKKVLKSEDLLGTEPKDLRNDNEPWKKLQDMIGLEKVKSECGDIIDYAQINYRRELQGMEPLKIGLNRVFLGPPGVGKTTVAQLYGQILIDLGLVSGKKIMLRNPSHLIGAYIGHSEMKTMDVLKEARGNVLIIDDAHMLYPGAQDAGHKTDVFRIAVLDTIVANVSAEPEDRCIILVGYDHEMGQLFNNSNPGLQRRFPKDTALRFDAYSEDELCQIMDLEVDKSGLQMSKDAAAVSRQVLSRMRINPKFGNAGDVENLLNQAKVRINARITSASRESGSVDVVIEPSDIDPHWDRESQAGESRATLFEGFVGFNRIVEQFEGYQHLVAGMRLYDIDPRPHVPWSFIFKGPPGTGKTSTARKVGRLYYDMGLLSTDEVVTCSVSDLVGKHVGETGPKVLNTLETGLGKVLFIDEAYRLANDSKFHVEAIGELVDAMTQVRYRNNMVIILAGYTVEMDFLLQVNPGLRSRFPEQIVFQPMSSHACLRHLREEVSKLKVNIMGARGANDDKLETVYRLFKKLGLTKGWASGRDVETLAKTIIGNAYKRAGRTKKKLDTGSLQVTLEEVIEAQKGMLAERLGRMSNEAED